MEGWGKVKAVAKYAGVSERTVRTWTREGLRHVRLPSGTILIRREWIDEFLGACEVQENRVEAIVEEVLGELKR